MEGEPLWLSRLKIQYCQCYGMGSIPGQELLYAAHTAEKRKKKEQ